MTTLCRRAFVSIAATLTMTLALGACAGGIRRVVDEPIWSGAQAPTIRFENLARDNVDVYLIGEKREWLLGRVATGAIASLPIPDQAITDGTTLRLAVLVGARLTFTAARDPRAVMTIAQPAGAMLSQRWAFSQGYFTSVPY